MKFNSMITLKRKIRTGKDQRKIILPLFLDDILIFLGNTVKFLDNLRYLDDKMIIISR